MATRTRRRGKPAYPLLFIRIAIGCKSSACDPSFHSDFKRENLGVVRQDLQDKQEIFSAFSDRKLRKDPDEPAYPFDGGHFTPME
jgi:hypothetical protein